MDRRRSSVLDIDSGSHEVRMLLERVGLYVDELGNVRVLEPSVTENSVKLRDVSSSFVSDFDDYIKTTQQTVDKLDALSRAVENERMKAITAKNALRSAQRNQDEQYQRLKTEIQLRAAELQRLKAESESYDREIAAQQQQLESLNGSL